MHTFGLVIAVIEDTETARVGTTVSEALPVEGSSPPMLSRNGGYASVMSVG